MKKSRKFLYFTCFFIFSLFSFDTLKSSAEELSYRKIEKFNLIKKYDDYSIITFPNDMVLNNGMLIKAGTRVEIWKYGHIKKCTLGNNWEAPNEIGMLLKAGTEYEQFKDGYHKGATLGQDWKSVNRVWIKAGTEIEWFERNLTKELEHLEENLSYLLIPDKNKYFSKSEIEAKSFQLTTMKRFTLAKDWRSSEGKLIKAGTEVELFRNGQVRKTTIPR